MCFYCCKPEQLVAQYQVWGGKKANKKNNAKGVTLVQTVSVLLVKIGVIGALIFFNGNVDVNDKILSPSQFCQIHLCTRVLHPFFG